MKKKIVEILYIILNVGLFLLAIYSFLFGGVETTMLEDLWLMMFAGVLALIMVVCVLCDKEDEDDSSDMDNSDSGDN